MRDSNRLLMKIMLCHSVLLGIVVCAPIQGHATTQTTSAQTTVTTTSVNAAKPVNIGPQSESKNVSVNSDTNGSNQQSATENSRNAASERDTEENTASSSDNQTNASSQMVLSSAQTNSADMTASSQESEATHESTGSLTLATDHEVVASGTDVNATLSVSMAGNVDQRTDQKLIVQLPTTFPLSDSTDLTIGGKTPTYDKQKATLTYDFEQGLTATSLTKTFTFKTNDQPLINDTKLTIAATLMLDQQVVASAQQSVTVETKASMSIYNQVLGVIEANAAGGPTTDDQGNIVINPKLITGAPGDFVVYSVTVLMPKKLGQAYLAPGTAVLVNVALPPELAYASNIAGTPVATQLSSDGDAQNRSYYQFVVAAPSIAEQMANPDYVFAESFQFAAEILPTVAPGTTITTVAQGGGTTVAGQSVASQLLGNQIMVAEGVGSNVLEPQDGGVHYFQTYDPSTPQITPDGELQFVMRIGPAFMSAPDRDYTEVGEGTRAINKYVVTYDVDPHLNADGLMLKQPTTWILGQQVISQEQPKFDLYVKYEDETDYEKTALTGYTAGEIDLNQYLDNSRGVDKIQLRFTLIPNGLDYDDGLAFVMTPKQGYYGTVTNTLLVEEAGYVFGRNWVDLLYGPDGAIVVGPDGEGPGGYLTPGEDYGAIYFADYPDNIPILKQAMAPRTAEIVKPQKSSAMLNEDVNVVKQVGQLAIAGDNQLIVTVGNSSVATDYLTGVTSYLILPKGVTYTGDEQQIQVLTTDFEQAGQTLLKINWQNTAITPGQQNQLTVPVWIDPSLNLSQLVTSLYTSADGNQGATLTDSSAADVALPVLPSQYTFLNPNQVAFAVTKRGSIQMTAQGSQIKMNQVTNEIAAGQTGTIAIDFAADSTPALTQLNLVGTLEPGLHLTESVTLPVSWRGRVVVQYTTAQNPSTTSDWHDATEVANFTRVTGFKISYDDASSYLVGSAQQILLRVLVDATCRIGQVTGVQYQVAANQLLPITGLTAPVTVVMPVLVRTQVPNETPHVTADQYYNNLTPNQQPGGTTTTETPVPDPSTTEQTTAPTTEPTTTPIPATQLESVIVPDSDSLVTVPAPIESSPEVVKQVTELLGTESDSRSALTQEASAVQSKTTKHSLAKAKHSNNATIKSVQAAHVVNHSATVPGQSQHKTKRQLPQTRERTSTGTLIGLLMVAAISILGGHSVLRKRYRH